MRKFIIKKVLTREFVEQVKATVSKKALNGRSITKGKGNLPGELAEICCMEIFTAIHPHNPPRHVSAEAKDTDTPEYNYDILLFSADGKSVKADIKAKNRYVAPKYDYAASVADYSIPQQKCQVYCFAQILNSPKPASYPIEFYYCGHIEKTQFLDESEAKKKGEPDGGNYTNGRPFLIVEDCHNLKYDRLSFFEDEAVEMLLPLGYQKYYWR